MSDQSNVQHEAGFMSLAELAQMNTDQISVLTSRLPDEGIYVVKGEEVKAGENERKDESQPPLFYFSFIAEVIEAKPLNKERDPESYLGKKLRERYTLWPSDFSEAIGLLRGRYQIIGLPNTGALGGLEGQAPGWLDGMVGHMWRVRVRHFTDKNGAERASFDWLPLEDKKAA